MKVTKSSKNLIFSYHQKIGYLFMIVIISMVHHKGYTQDFDYTSTHKAHAIIADSDNANSTEDIVFGFNATTVESGNFLRAVTIEDNTGNVGIGTPYPNGKLHIVGSDNNGTMAGLHIESPGNQLLLLDGNEIDAMNTELYLNNNSDNDVSLVNGGGNVGIGTNDPFALLHLKGENVDGTSQLILHNTKGNANSSTGVDFRHSDDKRLQAYIRDEITGGWPTKLHFGTASGIDNATTKMTIDGSGNVGIGTTSPTEKLEVAGNIKVEDDSDILGLDIIQGFNDLRFEASPSSGVNLSIEENGNVGIGTTVPNEKLEVYDGNMQVYNGNMKVFNGEYQSNGNLVFHPDIDNTGDDEILFNNGAGSEMMRIHNNGNVGIGTTAPATTLDVTGTGHFSNSIGIGTATPSESLDVVGNARVNGKITTKEVEVTPEGWADFVFEETYTLPTLDEVEAHITAHKHLPGVPSAQEVMDNGIELGAMNATLLQKIEELTLYVIDLKKELEEVKSRKTLRR